MYDGMAECGGVDVGGPVCMVSRTRLGMEAHRIESRVCDQHSMDLINKSVSSWAHILVKSEQLKPVGEDEVAPLVAT